LNGCRIREVPEARLTRKELGLRAVCLTDKRLFHLNLTQLNPYGLFTFTTGLDIGLDNTLFIDDLLEVVQKKVVVRI
jgi:hypothetical protein